MPGRRGVPLRTGLALRAAWRRSDARRRSPHAGPGAEAGGRVRPRLRRGSGAPVGSGGRPMSRSRSRLRREETEVLGVVVPVEHPAGLAQAVAVVLPAGDGSVVVGETG